MIKIKYKNQLQVFTGGTENLANVITFRTKLDKILIMNFFKELADRNKLDAILNSTSNNITIDLDSIIEEYTKSAGLPVFYGIENLNIVIDDNLDPISGISAIDKENGNLRVTYKIKNVATNTEITLANAISTLGEKRIFYYCEDSNGNKAEESCTLYVHGKLSYSFPSRIDLRARPIMYTPDIVFNYTTYKGLTVEVKPSTLLPAMDQSIIGKTSLLIVAIHPINQSRINVKQDIFFHGNIELIMKGSFAQTQGFPISELTQWLENYLDVFITNVSDNGTTSNTDIEYKITYPIDFSTNKIGIQNVNIDAVSEDPNILDLHTSVSIRIMEANKPEIVTAEANFFAVINKPINLRNAVTIINSITPDLSTISYIITDNENNGMIAENEAFAKIGIYTVTYTFTDKFGHQAEPVSKLLYVNGDIVFDLQPKVHTRMDTPLPKLAHFYYFNVQLNKNQDISFEKFTNGIKDGAIKVDDNYLHRLKYKGFHPINESIIINYDQLLYVHSNPIIEILEYDKYVFKNDTTFNPITYINDMKCYVLYTQDDGSVYKKELNIEFAFSPAFNIEIVGIYKLSMKVYETYEGTKGETYELVNIHIEPTNKPVLSSEFDLDTVIDDPEIDLMRGIHSHDAIDGDDFGTLSLQIFNSDNRQILKEDAFVKIGIYRLVYTIKNSQNVISEPVTRYLRIHGNMIYRNLQRVDTRQASDVYFLQNDFHYYDVNVKKNVYPGIKTITILNNGRTYTATSINKSAIGLHTVTFIFVHPINKKEFTLIQKIYVHGNPEITAKVNVKNVLAFDDKFDLNKFIKEENFSIRINKINDDGTTRVENSKPTSYYTVPLFNVRNVGTYKANISVADTINESTVNYYYDMVINVVAGNTPIITSNKDLVDLIINDEINPLDGVTCTDIEDITLSVTYTIARVKDNVNVTLSTMKSNVEEYKITYYATDSNGNKAANKYRIVRVYSEIYLRDYEIETPFDRLDYRVEAGGIVALLENLSVDYLYEDYNHDIIQVPPKYVIPYVNGGVHYTLSKSFPIKYIVTWKATHPIDANHTISRTQDIYIQGNPFIVVNEPEKYVVKGNPVFVLSEFIAKTKCYTDHVNNLGVVVRDENPVSYTISPVFNVNNLNIYYITYTASDKWRDSIITVTAKATIKVINGTPITTEGNHIDIGNIQSLARVIISPNSFQQDYPRIDRKSKVNHHGIESKNKVRLTTTSLSTSLPYWKLGVDYIEINRTEQESSTTKKLAFRPDVDFLLIDQNNTTQKYYLVIEVIENTTGSNFSINNYKETESMSIFHKLGTIATFKSYETKKMIYASELKINPDLAAFKGHKTLFSVAIPNEVISGKIKLRYALYHEEEIYHTDELVYLPYMEPNQAGFIIKLPNGKLINNVYPVYEEGLKHTPNELIKETVNIDYLEKKVNYTQYLTNLTLDGTGAREQGIDYLIEEPELSPLPRHTSGNGWTYEPKYTTRNTIGFYMIAEDLELFKDQYTIWCDSLRVGYVGHFEDLEECLFQDERTIMFPNFDGTLEEINVNVFGIRINANRIKYAGDPFNDDVRGEELAEAFMVWILSNPIKISYPCSSMYIQPSTLQFKEADLEGFNYIQIMSPMSINTRFIVTYYTNDGPSSGIYGTTERIAAKYTDGIHRIAQINYNDLKVWKLDKDENFEIIPHETKELILKHLEPKVVNDIRYPWIKNNEGVWKSGNKGTSSSSSTVKFEFNLVTEGTIDFDYVVDSETNYDVGSFIINKDNTQIYTSDKISGSSNKIHYHEELEAGNYNIIFSFTKDSSNNIGTDEMSIYNFEIITKVADFTYTLDRETFNESGKYEIEVTYVE